MEKIKQLFDWMTKKGIPLAVFRDPITQQPSVSLTMLVVSFTLSIIALINKFAKLVDGMDVENTLQLLIICASLYFGRSLSKKMNDKKE